jgi:hydroxymethylglutaryl-CoA lyase
MSRTSQIDILVSEVGPRDGLQSVAQIMPTQAKIKWIEGLAAAGLREIEVGSFVSANRLPQLAGTGEVAAHSIGIENLMVLALVPNLCGAADAVTAGARSLTVPLSVSRMHSQANIGKTPEEAVQEVERICRYRGSPPGPPVSVEVGLSTAFGCTMEGPVDEDRVLQMAAQCAAVGADSVGLSDTTGYANPAQIKRMFTLLRTELGDRAGGAHLSTPAAGARERGRGPRSRGHDLRLVPRRAWRLPLRPGASGNIVTEDLVYLLGAMNAHRQRRWVRDEDHQRNCRLRARLHDGLITRAPTSVALPRL